MEQKKISKAVLKRLPGYLAYLKNMPEGASPNISATALANALDMGEAQLLRKAVQNGLGFICRGKHPVSPLRFQFTAALTKKSHGFRWRAA